MNKNLISPIMHHFQEYLYSKLVIQQNIKNLHGTQQDTRHYLQDYIKNTGVNLNTEIDLQKIQMFISIGPELQIAAKNIGKKIGNRSWKIQRTDFLKFVDEVQTYSVEECMAKYQITYNDAQSFGIGLLSYKLFLGLTNTEKIIVTDTTIREGLLISKLSSEENLQQEFTSQVVASAVNIGRKYRFDEVHAKSVCKVALKIYDAMEKELGLNFTESWSIGGVGGTNGGGVALGRNMILGITN